MTKTREGYNAYKRRWRAARKAAGVCAYCPEAVVPGTSRCPTCTINGRVGVRTDRMEKITNGICTSCRKSKAETGKQRCRPCADKGLARKHGISEADVRRLREGGCEVCGSHDRLHFDHCHSTGRFRGVLCRSCNQGLGFLQDDADLLRRLIGYLERPR